MRDPYDPNGMYEQNGMYDPMDPELSQPTEFDAEAPIAAMEAAMAIQEEERLPSRGRRRRDAEEDEEPSRLWIYGLLLFVLVVAGVLWWSFANPPGS